MSCCSFDTVSGTVQLLETLQPAISLALEDQPNAPITQKLSDIVIQSLETIAELVQGPCFENQEAVISSGFVVILNRLFATLKYKEPPEHAASGNVRQPLQQPWAPITAARPLARLSVAILALQTPKTTGDATANQTFVAFIES